MAYWKKRRIGTNPYFLLPITLNIRLKKDWDNAWTEETRWMCERGKSDETISNTSSPTVLVHYGPSIGAILSHSFRGDGDDKKIQRSC